MGTPPKDTQFELDKKNAEEAAAALARAQAKGGQDAHPSKSKKRKGAAGSDTPSPLGSPRGSLGEDERDLAFDVESAGENSPGNNNPGLTKEALDKLIAAQGGLVKNRENGSDKLSNPDTDPEDTASNSDNDTGSVTTDASDTPSTPRTKRRGLITFAKDLLGGIGSTLAGGISQLTTKVNDNQWEDIKARIAASATDSGLTIEKSKDGKTITLSGDSVEPISVKRGKGDSLTFSSKAPTDPGQLAALLVASKCTECTISEAESAEMATKLLNELTGPGKNIEVKISKNVLNMMRKKAEEKPETPDSLACRRALDAYLAKNPGQRTTAEKTAAQQVPAKPSNAPTAGSTGGSQVLTPPKAGDSTSGSSISPRKPKL